MIIFYAIFNSKIVILNLRGRDVIRQQKLLKFKAEAKEQNPQTTTVPFLVFVPSLKMYS